MRLPISIAKRYFFSGNKRSFINVISGISMLTLALGTAALFIVLSVFNGLSNLISNVHESFDADLEILPQKGKVYSVTDSLLMKLQAIEGIKNINPVVEDDAFVNYKDQQKVVKVKGVDSSYFSNCSVGNYLIKGGTNLVNKNQQSFAVFGRGIEIDLNVNMDNLMAPLQIWYPNRKKKVFKDEKSFNKVNVLPGGVFEIERQYDDVYMFMPVADARYLFSYNVNEVSALELNLKEDVDKNKVIDALNKACLGLSLNVKTAEEKHSVLYKAIRIEKFIALVIFVFILSIAAINIFLTLSMIVLSKRKDIAVLKTIGATNKTIRNIFLFEGLIIGGIGSVFGLIFGLCICLLQEKFGFYKLDIQSSITDAFPIRVQLLDVFSTIVVTFGITILISLKPAFDAAKVKIENQV